MENYKIIKTLKKCNKSCVYKALDIKTNLNVAIKEISNVRISFFKIRKV